MAQNRKR